MDSKVHVFLTVFMAATITGFFLSEGNIFNEFEGLSTVEDVSVGDNSVSVSTKCFRLDMVISQDKASLIQNKLQRTTFERPIAQEIIGEVSNGDIERVEITGISEGAYHADIVLDSGINERRVDLRPSDGILVAADQDIPLLIDQNLIRNHGVNTCLQGSIEI